MCSASSLIVLYICVKFCENTSECIRVGDTNDGRPYEWTFKISEDITQYPCHFLWRGIKYIRDQVSHIIASTARDAQSSSQMK